jgi:hypothetical protein
MASGAHGSFVSLHAPWQQEATPQLSADTGDVMDKVRRRLEDIIRSAFTRSGRSMATFCHNTEWSVPGSPAYHRFMAAVHPNGGALSTVSLAIACTPRENVDSICEHGLRQPRDGVQDPSFFLARCRRASRENWQCRSIAPCSQAQCLLAPLIRVRGKSSPCRMLPHRRRGSRKTRGDAESVLRAPPYTPRYGLLFLINFSLSRSLSLSLTLTVTHTHIILIIREKVSFIHNATHAKGPGTYKIKTLGSRLGSLY